jgi:hypothetical protein
LFGDHGTTAIATFTRKARPRLHPNIPLDVSKLHRWSPQAACSSIAHGSSKIYLIPSARNVQQTQMQTATQMQMQMQQRKPTIHLPKTLRINLPLRSIGKIITHHGVSHDQGHQT